MHRRTAAAVATLLTAGLTAASATAAETVRTRGGVEFEPNQFIRDTHRWEPGHIVVTRNERVTWVDGDESSDPHTITVANERALPDTTEELVECRVCELAIAHLGPNDPDFARMRVNVGRAGLNQHGDSLALLPGGRISAKVTAPVGRTLHYLCALHPWMQGSITVARSGAGGGGAGLTGRHHR